MVQAAGAAVVSEPGQTARLSPEVRRMLLTIQYERKMAGEALSFNDIIKRALEQQQASQPVKP